MDFAKIISKAAEYKAVALTFQDSQGGWIREFAHLFAAKAISCLAYDCVVKRSQKGELESEIKALTSRINELERKLFPNNLFPNLYEYRDNTAEEAETLSSPDPEETIPPLQTSRIFEDNAPNFEAFTHKYQGLVCNEEMIAGSNDKSQKRLDKCKEPEDEFHQHEYVSEWFSDHLNALLRVKALDPFMWFHRPKSKKSDPFRFIFVCKEIGCAAHLTVRKVLPNTANMDIGMYGCLGHSHDTELPDCQRELVFDNKQQADMFIKQHFDLDFGLERTIKTGHYYDYRCFRSLSIDKDIHLDCPARFRMQKAFSIKAAWNRNVPEAMDADICPFTIKGLFKHSHPRDVNCQKMSSQVKEFIDFHLKNGEKPSELYKRYMQESDLNKLPGKPVSYNYIRERQRLVAKDHYQWYKSQGPNANRREPKRKSSSSPIKPG